MLSSQEERKEKRALVGHGSHHITPDLWAISLVRKLKKDHAYLILEGVDADGKRVMMDAHLVIKQGSNEKKGEVVFRTIGIDALREVAEGCHSYTWHLEHEGGEEDKVNKFLELMKSEKERGEKDEIDYQVIGHTVTAGLFGQSLDKMHSEDVKDYLQNHSSNKSMDLLLRRGHNCGSWACSVLLTIGVTPPTSPLNYIVVRPKSFIKDTHDGDEEPDTKARCRLM